MNDLRRRKRGAGLGRAYWWPIGKERHDNELRSGQGARGRADDYEV